MIKYIVGLALVAGYSWLQWDRNYVYTNNFSPASLQQPVTTQIEEPSFIENTPEYDIEISPKLRFEVSGLVVIKRKNESSLLSSASFKSIMPGTLMLAFGDALTTKAYKNLVKRGNYVMVKDKQVEDQISSVSMITTSQAAVKKFRSLNQGDQVTLRGYAGDIKIFKTGERASGNSISTVGTSKSIIFIRQAEDITILSRGSRIFFYLFAASLSAAAVLLLALLKP